MGQKITQNFEKRFGGNITVAYRQKSLEPEELQIRNSRLLKAFTQVLTGILKREPTQEELLGINKIKIPKEKSTKNTPSHTPPVHP